MEKTILSYNKSQSIEDKKICNELMKEINNNLGKDESKIWHGSPVWFIEGNPIVGYHKLKDCVRLLFWSGQSFNESKLKTEGSFKAAEIRYTKLNQIDKKDLKKWLRKSKEIQWDYKNIVKRKGKLIKINARDKKNDKNKYLNS